MNLFKETNIKKRGSGLKDMNRFEDVRLENFWEDLEFEESDQIKSIKTQFLPDATKTILTRNNSPDIPFTYSVNPYRGCEHGCAYCYARPSHEMLGFNAGLDFETRIMVKHNAPQLLREALSKASWQKEPVSLSGVTDCYQPAERRFRLTRQCLEVFLEFNSPVTIVTKNILILRDLEVLRELARKDLVHVYISITSLDEKLQEAMEPRTSKPAARLKAIETLAKAGIPAGSLIAPVIPGLTDGEMPSIVSAVSDHGACCAHYVLLRLPMAVEPIFLDWLEGNFPSKAAKVKHLLTSMRGGSLNDPSFGSRFTGKGVFAENLASLFKVQCRRHSLGSCQWSHGRSH